jgi:hypothetical protein
MSFLKRIFASAGAPQSSPPASQLSLSSGGHSRNLPGQDNTSRRELLRLVLRDTLNRTGIPVSWIGADLLAATSRGREPGIHVRLLLKHWDPRLMLHGIAFENAFKKRVLTLDSGAERWLLGISWQYSLANESACPPMPHPGVWTSSIPEPVAACEESAANAAMRERDPSDLLGGSIVISGPAATPDSSAARPAAAAAVMQAGRHAAPEAVTDARAEAKADLERLFAIRDEDMKRHAGVQPPQFAATEPAGLDQIPAASGDTEAAALRKSFAKTDVFRRPDRPIAPVRQ